mmetsp:Transcript_40261/g.92437  ORF Transcript_40261/g.92437 Transcript_40261/m.92437 type:complete len:94 (-) Transcript_40261:105-386(-)
MGLPGMGPPRGFPIPGMGPPGGMGMPGMGSKRHSFSDRPPPTMEHATMERVTQEGKKKRRPRTMKLQKSDMMTSLKLVDQIDVPDAAEEKKES